MSESLLYDNLLEVVKKGGTTENLNLILFLKDTLKKLLKSPDGLLQVFIHSHGNSSLLLKTECVVN